MLKSKHLLLALLPAAMVLAACEPGNPTSSSTTSEDPTVTSTSEDDETSTPPDGGDETSTSLPPVVVENPEEDWNKALEGDYSNLTTHYATSFSDFPVYTFYTQGYKIVRDDSFYATYGYTEYMYYHDYQGDSYLYFEDEGNGEAWLKDGYHGADLRMQNTYLDYQYMVEALKAIDYSDIEFAPQGLPIYYITAEDLVEAFTFDAFAFLAWDSFLPIYYGFTVDTELGIIASVVAFDGYEEENPNYISASLTDDSYGLTEVPLDATLPPEPNEQNVRTYADYKDEEPWVETHVTSINLAAVAPEQSLTIGVGTSFEADFTYLPEDANTVLFIPMSSDETKVTIEHNFEGTLTVSGLGVGEADVYVVDDITGIISNKLHVTVIADQSEITLDPVAELTFQEKQASGLVTNENAVAGGLTIATSTSDPETVDVDYIMSTDNLGFDPMERAFMFKPGGNWDEMEADLIFDAGEGQTLKGLGFEYGLLFAHNEENLSFWEAFVEVSDDGTEWAEEEDWTEEFRANASGSHLRLHEVEFESAHRYARIRIDGNFTGKSVWVATQAVTLY